MPQVPLPEKTTIIPHHPSRCRSKRHTSLILCALGRFAFSSPLRVGVPLLYTSFHYISLSCASPTTAPRGSGKRHTSLHYFATIPFHNSDAFLQFCNFANFAAFATFYLFFYTSIRRLLIPFPLIRFVRCRYPSSSARFITAVMPPCPAIAFPELTFYCFPPFCCSLSFYFLSSKTNSKTKK